MESIRSGRSEGNGRSSNEGGCGREDVGVGAAWESEGGRRGEEDVGGIYRITERIDMKKKRIGYDCWRHDGEMWTFFQFVNIQDH